MKESIIIQDHSIIPPLEQDVVPNLIQIGKKSYKLEDALKASFAIIGGLCSEILSGDVLTLAMYAALKYKPENMTEENYKELIKAVFEQAEKIRKSNPLAKVLF